MHDAAQERFAKTAERVAALQDARAGSSVYRRVVDLEQDRESVAHQSVQDPELP